jgi:hypothetical protein
MFNFLQQHQRHRGQITARSLLADHRQENSERRTRKSSPPSPIQERKKIDFDNDFLDDLLLDDRGRERHRSESKRRHRRGGGTEEEEEEGDYDYLELLTEVN